MQSEIQLIGMCTSPFVRRVAIALNLYGRPYLHREWSVWRDADRIAAHNPLRRVPALVLPSGETLCDSAVILDVLDEDAPEGRRLIPERGPLRRACLRACAFACGASDKAVSLLYEGTLKPEAERSAEWMARCETQIRDTLALLERERAAQPGDTWWLGEALSHADIAVTVALGFLEQAHPAFYPPSELPALRALAARVEALPEVRSTRASLQVRAGAGFGGARPQ